MLYLEQVFRISVYFFFRSDQRSRHLQRCVLLTRVYLYPPMFHSRSSCGQTGQLRSNLDRFELRTAYQRRASGQLRPFGSALSLPTSNVSSTGREFSISPTPSPYKCNTLYQTCTAFDGNSKNFEFFTYSRAILIFTC